MFMEIEEIKEIIDNIKYDENFIYFLGFLE